MLRSADKPAMISHVEGLASVSIEQAFDQFVGAVTCKSILSSFQQLLAIGELQHVSHSDFYLQLKSKLQGSWKAQSLWAKLDKRASHKDYKKGQACSQMKVLIIGAGPCGLRAAIESAFLGAKTVVVEKRDRFSRNNVLHLWPFLIADLRNLGAKKFFGKFCAGAIDHISIRQLQCVLLKVALLLGVEVHVNVTFQSLVEPPKDQTSGVGWRCRVTPEKHILSGYELDVLIGADGKRNTLSGFKRKEFRGKLAIAVTANFINRNTQAEASVEEISGVAFIFNQKFFLDLKESTRIDLENIVYYKDDTHYFVMTAKKASLLEKGVLKADHSDTQALLDKSNVNQNALMAYAREAADFSTNYKLPNLEYAVNHYGQADVAMFDFTSMFAADNASRFLLRNGHHLLMGLVGDSLLEPFWPTGSGCARGFLSSFDAAWMMRSWASGKTPLQVLVERESIYTVLSQTTPNYLNKNYNSYSIDPNTRYPNLNLKVVSASQVKHLYDGGDIDTVSLDTCPIVTVPTKKLRKDMGATDSSSLLQWCQKILNSGRYKGVHVVDLTSSWRSGLALCALIHSFRPDIIDFSKLQQNDVVTNNQLAFSLAEVELGIPPVMTGKDMARCVVPDKLTMVSYLSQFYDLFKHEHLPCPTPSNHETKVEGSKKSESSKPSNRRISFLQKLNSRLARKKKRKEQEMDEGRALKFKKLDQLNEEEVVPTPAVNLPTKETSSQSQMNKRNEALMARSGGLSSPVSVPVMADILAAKFRGAESTPVPGPVKKSKTQPAVISILGAQASETCYFCQKRVYIMERMSAEGVFFHRGCLRCDYCGIDLRVTNYSCDKDANTVTFYCSRHAIPDMRLRPKRKRTLVDLKNLPDVIVTPATSLGSDLASKDKKVRRDLTSSMTVTMSDRDKRKTPERVEFEISFDGTEESEEEQFEHNLRASLTSAALLEDSDQSSTDSDDFEAAVSSEMSESSRQLFRLPGSSFTPLETSHLRSASKERSHTRSESPIQVKAESSSRVQPRSREDQPIAALGRDKRTNEDIQNNNLVKPKQSILKNSYQKLGEMLSGEHEDYSKLIENLTTKQLLKRTAIQNSKQFLEVDNGENGAFIEGRLSPSASRTRRFRAKRNTKHSKQAEGQQSQKVISSLDQGLSNQLNLGSKSAENFIRSANGIQEDITVSMGNDLFISIDDRFVTNRQKRSFQQNYSLSGDQKKGKVLRENGDQDSLGSNFSLSTPSDTDGSSVSSLEIENGALNKPKYDDSGNTSIRNKSGRLQFDTKNQIEYNKDLLATPVTSRSRSKITTTGNSISTPSPFQLTRPLPPPESKNHNSRLKETSGVRFTSHHSQPGSSVSSGLGHDSSDSDIFMSPLEDPQQSSPLVNISSSSYLSSSTKTPVTRNIPASHLKQHQMPAKPFLSSQLSKISSQNTDTSNSLKSDRKLPDLPKLNIPSKRLAYPSGNESSINSSEICSSPTLSNSEEKYYTPCASNLREVKLTATGSTAVHSPSPDQGNENKALSVKQIRDIYQAEVEKARFEARNRAKMKTDEELGICTNSPVHAGRTHLLNRNPSRKSSVPGPVGTQDESVTQTTAPNSNNSKVSVEHNSKATLEDRDNRQNVKATVEDRDNRQNLISPRSQENVSQALSGKETAGQLDKKELTRNIVVIPDTSIDVPGKIVNQAVSPISPTSTANKINSPPPVVQPPSPKGKKGKVKSPQPKKQDSKSVNSEVKDKKSKSFLARIGLAKSSKKETKEINLAANSDSLPSSPSGSSKNKSKDKEDKKKKIKKKNSKDKEKIEEDPGVGSEYSKSLSVYSVFHSDILKRVDKNVLDVSGAMQNMKLDEVSYSEDSDAAYSPMQIRKAQTLEERVAQRLHKLQKKQQKQAEQRRLRIAQEIQRQLQEVDVRQRDLEERGITVEKALREDKAGSEDETQLMNEWFTLVNEKNALLRYESELMVRAKELELEDRQARLEQDFREKTKRQVEVKTDSDLAAENSLLEELLDVVEQRNSLVAMLDQDRIREQKEDVELREMMAKKGYILSPLSFDTWRERTRIN